MTCVAASSLCADDIAIEAQLNKDTCSLRESVFLTVKIAGVPNPPKPFIPPIDGLAVECIGSNLQEQGAPLDPATLRKPVSFFYRLTPKRLGKMEIPPLAFRTNTGAKILTAPLTLSVIQTPKHDVILCEMIANKTDIYLYEAVQITLKVHTKMGEQIRAPGGKARLSIDWLRQIPGFVAVEDVERHQKLKRLRSVHRHGNTYAAEAISRMLFPTEAGERTIPRASIDFECLKNFLPPRTSAIPDPDFGDVFRRGRGANTSQRLRAESNELNIRVRPLPEEGKPKEFKGAVGQFKMDTTLSGRNVKVGEPITVTSIIRGTGYPATIEPPVPKAPTGFKVYAGDQDTKTKRSANKIEVTRTFKTLFEPQTTTVKALPEMVFHYFDPQEARYVTRSYGPTRITVSRPAPKPLTARRTGRRSTTAPRAGGPATGGTPSVTQTSAPLALPPQPQVLKGDIQPIVTAGAGLRDQGRLFIQEPWFLLAAFAPLLVAALCAVIQHHRERLQTDTAFARNTFAMRNAKRHLAAARTALGDDAKEFHGLLFRVLTEYIGDKLNVPAATVTSQAVADLLQERGLGLDLTAEATTCLEECEQGRFAPGSREVDTELLRRTKALLKELGRALR